MDTLYLYESGSQCFEEEALRASHPEWDGSKASRKVLLQGNHYANIGSALLGLRFERIVIRFDSLFHWLQTASEREKEYMGQALHKLRRGGEIFVEDRCTGERLVEALKMKLRPLSIEERVDAIERKLAVRK